MIRSIVFVLLATVSYGFAPASKHWGRQTKLGVSRRGFFELSGILLVPSFAHAAAETVPDVTSTNRALLQGSTNPFNRFETL